MRDCSAAEEEIDREINSWGYTMNATDYMSGLQNVRPSASFARSAVPMGRGRGCVDVSRERLEQVRLAAEINRQEAHRNPMGHLPTTEETLEKDVGPEITAGLRSVGILSSAGELNSKTTRRNVNLGEDMRIDRNVPLMLSSEFFHSRSSAGPCQELELELPPQPALKYDPSKPLAEQFTTIKEFHTQPTVVGDDEPKAAATKSPKKQAAPKKGKKHKWTKVPVEEYLAPPSWNNPNQGRPPVAVNSMFEARNVYGIDGKHVIN
uniref:Uncharacterized protein n=1 Tax=Anopheles stephensi TaxID=30069 RepID=A0A182Y0K1_ANOST